MPIPALHIKNTFIINTNKEVILEFINEIMKKSSQYIVISITLKIHFLFFTESLKI